MRRGLRYTVRLLIVVGALLVATIVLAGRANAADAPPDAAPSQQATNPPAGASPAGSDVNAVVATEASDPTPVDSPPAAAPPPGDWAGVTYAAPGGYSPGGWTGSTTTTNQSAQVTTSGTAVATTGSNVAIGNGSGNPGGVEGSGTTDSASGVGTGPSVAAGDQSTSGIDQQVQVTASTDGQIEVLQVALVINIGLAGSNSGVNAASAVPGVAGTGGSAGLASGNATVTGNQAATQVIQAAQIASGDNTGQTITVLNIGIGFGDTGTNLAVGTLYTDSGQAAQASAVVNGAGAGGAGTANIGTGSAGAIGNRADSGIVQITMAVASHGGVLNVAQRAVIVNVGLAFANSGLNAAWASGMTPEQAELIQWVIEALLDEFGVMGGGSGGALAGGSAGSATLQAGTALAIGNDSTTTILQQVQGAVSGGAASAHQDAMVGNFGLGVANTGLNAAGSGLTNIDPGVVAQVQAAESALQRLIALFTDSSFTGQDALAVQQAIDLGAALLSVNGDISAIETLAGVSEGAPNGAAVTVRQVSAVLNIGISVANSGDNFSVSVVSAEPSSGAVAAATGDYVHTLDVSHVLGEAMIRTGDAIVMGNQAMVRVCQTDRWEHACDQPVTPPVTPPVKPPVTPPVTPDGPIEVEPGVLGRPGASAPTAGSAAGVGAELAYTGSSPLDQASAGLGLAAAGLPMMIRRRRRRGKGGRRGGDRLG